MDCHFCQRNIKEIDFKNTKVLKNFISGLGKIRPRKKTNLCAKHQRHLSTAVKRARHLGLLSTQEK
jgi:small subunit ribosomal protein S18